jgi:hypothetical protein
MADFSIRIRGTIPAVFVPQGGNPGTPMLARAGDNISWGNDTQAKHQPWPTRENGDLLTTAEVTGANNTNFLSDVIPKKTPSSDWAVTPSTVTGKVIFYCCRLHEGEFGSIVIID